MAGVKKQPTSTTKRPYESPVRASQAEQTRARILDAAADLFQEHGYGRTTVRAIAAAAEVAPDTVYAVFGTKARVLTAIIDRRLAPAGDPNVMDRPEAQAVRSEDDQRAQIRRFAHDIAGVTERVRPIYEILRTASAVEPAMADIRAEMDGYRLNNMRRVAGWIAERGELRVDVERAAQTMWALISPDTGRMLCDGLGWTTEQYASWIEDTLVRTLLPDD